MDNEHGGREALFLIGSVLAFTLTVFAGSFAMGALVAP